MRKIIFPPIENATEDGLVALGGDLEVDTLLSAYQQGIFPWPVSTEHPLAWFSPDPRGILEISELHLSKSFVKFLKKNTYQVTFNQAFDEVINQCARMARKDQPSTWITQDIILGYEKLFKVGLAYSAEVWNGKELVAGVYGVSMGDFISGESMFTKENNASKFALYSLILKLKDSGIAWMDTQMVTPVVEGFGGKYISRPEFLHMLKKINWSRKRDDIF
jgi:leucyl/phenylalanyl-tRNA--protein transferase